MAELRAATPTLNAIALVFEAARELWPPCVAAARSARRCLPPPSSPPAQPKSWRLRPPRPERRSPASRAAARLISLGRLGPHARPRLVELDAPLAVLGLLQREPRRNDLPERPLKPVTARAVRPVAISSFATACGSVLPALLFQITNPQPGSSRDQQE